jgi:DNA-binding NtrC family response regulator
MNVTCAAAENLFPEDVEKATPQSNGIPDADGPDGFQEFIGCSGSMQQVYHLIRRVADSDSTILISGETGTGKGLAARAIHNCSGRRNHPFIAVNCGAIPENLLESELFGHVRGAFTGATANKIGKFERANGGTIFLDEIGDMSPELQVKLLKVLEEGEFEPVGGTRTLKVDVRIVAATHRDLDEEVQKGAFRQDLYYRLYVIPVRLPALRQRKTDIPLLVRHFLRRSNEKNHRRVEGITSEALDMLTAHAWPGNVRELKNLIERLVVMKGRGPITAGDLPGNLTGAACKSPVGTVEIGEEGICLNTAVSDFEKALIVQTLEKTNWVKNQAAKLLQLNRTTLVEKIKRHRLQPQAL